ncbi:MAG: hypothetical protein U0R44_05755 [Candidatus Micrarchaeia archaeon]
MAQPRQATAQDQTGVMDVGAVQRLRGDLVTQLTAIRTTLAQMTRDGIPAQVGATDRDMRRLIDTLATNATALGIPVTGTTPEEKFRSLNEWLNATWRTRSGLSGRNRDSPLNEAALNELELRLNVALARPTSGAVADQVLAGLRAAPADTAQQPAPSVGGVTPQRTVTASPGDAMRTQNAQLMADLQYIETNGATAAIKTRARQLRTQLESQFSARRPTQTTVDRLVRDATTFAYGSDGNSGALPAAVRRANETAITVNQGAQHPLATEVSDLLTSVQGMQGDVARSIAQRIPDVWLLGDAQLRQMVRLLTQARDSLRGGNETDARAKLTEAGQLFDREQTLYQQLIDQHILPIATASRTAIDASALPTRAQLTTAQGRDRGTTYLLRGARGMQNGREDLHNLMDRRVTEATRLSGQRGRLSYRLVSDLYQSVTLDERTVSTLISMWEYARQNGLDTLTGADRSSIWSSYSRAAMAIADPTFQVFNSYSREHQRRLVELHLGLPAGTRLTDAQYQPAARQLSELLMRNMQYRYDDVLFGVYDELSKRPQLATDSYVIALTRVRSVRPIFEAEYFPFLANNPQPTDAESRMSLADRTASINRRRFDTARGFLDTAIANARASGMADTDDLMRAASGWLTSTATAPTPERMVQIADFLYAMALDLSAIREAEIWAANAGLRPTGLPAASLTRARTQLDLARRSFIWNFSRTQVDPTYHPNEPRNIANGVIRMLAPPALANTEAPAMYSTLGAYGNPARIITVADSENPTRDERIRAAAAAEQRYISLLISLRDNATLFSGYSTDRTLDSTGMAGPRRALFFGIGRTAALQTVGPDFPSMEFVQARRRPTIAAIDQHQVGGENALDANLRNVMHEDLGVFPYGQLYVELYRDTVLHRDNSTPELLRGLNVAPDQYPIRTGTPYEAQDRRLKASLQAIARQYGIPTDQPFLGSLRSRMLEISASYSSRPLTEVQTEVNKVFMAYLDARIAELDSRLSGNVILADGQPIAVRDLERSASAAGVQHPQTYYITRAREALEQARRLRTDLAATPNGDLLSGPVSPRDATAIAEMGLESLTDGPNGHLTNIPRPLRPPEPTITAYVPSDQIVADRIGGEPRRVRFRADRVMIQPQTGAAVPLADYERQHGTQNLTYYWFIYQDLRGSAARPSDDQYLLNPRYQESGQIRYLGVTLRNVTLTDGTTGDFIVRVRESGRDPSTGPRYDPIRENDGRVRPENVVFRLRAGTMEPMRDAMLTERMRSGGVAFERASPAQTVEENGVTTPVLIVSPSASSASR